VDISRGLRVYGAKTSGSVAVEAAMTLLGVPYTVTEAAPWGTPEEKALLRSVSPLGQVPAVVLPDGAVITESAAILVWLGDLRADAGLAPPPDHPLRPRYLRWMVFVPAAIYAMYLLKDDPTVWLDDPAAQDQLRERAIERIKTCWRVMEANFEPSPWLLGERFSLLDLYVTVVSRWTPRRRWFAEACPKLHSVVRRVDAMPELQAFWAERFPFEEGWEG
jgi:GST-like protein